MFVQDMQPLVSDETCLCSNCPSSSEAGSKCCLQTHGSKSICSEKKLTCILNFPKISKVLWDQVMYWHREVSSQTILFVIGCVGSSSETI